MNAFFKKSFFLTVIVTAMLWFILSYSVTRAYLTASDRAENVFVVGETEGKIEEVFPLPSPGPGTASKKQVKIMNTGNLPAFVRVKLIYSDGIAEMLTGITGIDESVWVYDPVTDYFCCTKLVLPGEYTDDFMTGVIFYTESGAYHYGDLPAFDLSVYAELCQHYDHEGTCSATEYRECWLRGQTMR